MAEIPDDYSWTDPATVRRWSTHERHIAGLLRIRGKTLYFNEGSSFRSNMDKFDELGKHFGSFGMAYQAVPRIRLATIYPNRRRTAI